MLLGGINQGKGLGRVAQPSGPASSLLFPVNFTSCSSSRLSSERGRGREEHTFVRCVFKAPFASATHFFQAHWTLEACGKN